MSFRIVPVIDLKSGVPVHAVGGRREQYQPIRSVWQANPSPIAMAVSIRQGLGLDTIYVADLDAIEGRTSDFGWIERLTRDGLDVWLDAGIRDRRSVEDLSAAIRIVIGLETIAGPSDLAGIVEHVGRDRAIFSLDLDDGRPRLADGARWKSLDPIEIAGQVIAAGVDRLILLDLTRVGTGLGIGTGSLMSRILERFPEVDITVGGGIRDIADVLECRRNGASAVLVGSAIHDGRIGRRELEQIEALAK